MPSAFSLAGRRIDAPDATPRFPLANTAIVRVRLRELFQRHDASALFCAAAAGSDLIALELATELKIPAWIVLPFPPEQFRETSVIDRPGDWGAIYDQQVHLAREAGRLISHEHPVGDAETYVRANEDILDAAEHFSADGHKLRAVIAWEGKSRAVNDVTRAFADSARSRGIPVSEVLTL
jgi:hypothetical protein